MPPTETGNERKRKVIFGAIVLVVVIALSFGWFFFGKDISQITNTIKGTGIFVGGSDVPNGNNSNTSGDLQNGGTQAVGNRPTFFQITDFPVAGATYINAATASDTPMLRFARRDNGHIFNSGVYGGEAEEVSNTTIPRLYEALFLNNGKHVIYRSLETLGLIDTVVTRLGSIVSGNEGEKVVSTLLSDNITEVTSSQDGRKLYYVLPIANGSSISSVSVVTGEATEVAQNTYREWIPYATQRGIILATKASSNVPGYAYYLNEATKSLEAVLRKKSGLIILPDEAGKQYLYSENIGGNVVLGVKGAPRAGDEGVDLGDEHVFPITSTPAKCIWLSGGISAICQSFSLPRTASFPDDWYMGNVSLAGSFWKINTKNDHVDLLADPALSGGLVFDATQLFLSDDEKILYFTNKIDGTLWGMNIPETKEEGGQAPIIPEEDMKDYQGSI